MLFQLITSAPERTRSFFVRSFTKPEKEKIPTCTFIGSFCGKDNMFYTHIRCRISKLPVNIQGCIAQVDSSEVQVIPMDGDTFKNSVQETMKNCKEDSIEYTKEGTYKFCEDSLKDSHTVSEIIHILANSSNMNRTALEMIHSGTITHSQFKNLQIIAEAQMVLNNEDLVKEQCKSIILKEWQSNLEIELTGKVNERQITWIVDPIGSTGKSFFANYMLSKYPTEVFVAPGGGKSKDLFHAAIKIRNLETVIFDFPRSKEQYVCYEAIEQFKDGLFCSTKYNSATINLGRKLNVVVLSNWYPNIQMLSIDRWDIRYFDKLGNLVKNINPEVRVPGLKRINSFMEDDNIPVVFKQFANKYKKYFSIIFLHNTLTC